MSAGIWYYDPEKQGWRRAASFAAILARLTWLARKKECDDGE